MFFNRKKKDGILKFLTLKKNLSQTLAKREINHIVFMSPTHKIRKLKIGKEKP